MVTRIRALMFIAKVTSESKIGPFKSPLWKHRFRRNMLDVPVGDVPNFALTIGALPMSLRDQRALDLCVTISTLL
jgi:hypothetical protein